TPEAWFGRTDERLDADEVTRRLAELPLELREVIVARLWGGLTFEAVAALAGCSVPTAHRRYQAGLAQLRERLQGRWPRPPTAPTTGATWSAAWRPASRPPPASTPTPCCSPPAARRPGPARPASSGRHWPRPSPRWRSSWAPGWRRSAASAWPWPSAS